MADLQYGTSAYTRSRGNLPDLPVVNMFVEQTPTEQSPMLQSRPGLLVGANIGAAGSPIKGLYALDGVFSGTIFSVRNDNKFYNGITLLGTIDGSGPCKIAGYAGNVFATSGSQLWMWNGTTLSAVATPGSFSVASLCVGASHLIVVDSGTGKFYWTDALGTTLPSLNFATAEGSPDNLLDCLYVGDTLILFGVETVELWPSTGDAAAPFAPLVGRTFTKGIRGTGCCTLFNSTYAWITNRGQVCVGDPNNVVSFAGLEAKIMGASASSTYLWNFWIEGTEFLAVDFGDSAVWVYSSKSQQWSQFQSYGQSTWLPRFYTRTAFNEWLGSRTDSVLYTWSTDHKDFGGPLERRFRAGLELTGDILYVNNILLRCNPGTTPYTNPTQYYNPTISLQFSKDGSSTWSAAYVKSLGLNGELRKLINWRSLGRFKFPSLIVSIAVTDPVPFRVSGLKINEAYPN